MIEKDHQKYKILIVEDNPGDTLLIADYLEEAIVQPEIHTAIDFKSAGKFLQTFRDDLHIILLDLTLADLKGERLIAEMLPLAGNTPIIILTGYSDLDFAKKTLAIGASDYLLKDQLSATTLYKSIIYSIERNDYLLQIKESEKNYSDLFQLSPLPMWVYDLESLKFMGVNDAAVRHYGYSKSEFLDMTIKDIRPSSEWGHLESVLQESKHRDTYFFEGEFIHRKKDGGEIIVNIRSNIIQLRGRKAEIVLANDVTEKHKLQEELLTNTYLAETRERKRISSAIHDGLQQTLLAAFMRFESIESKSVRMEEETFQRFKLGKQLLKEGIEQARNIAHELVPVEVESSGLATAIEDLIDRTRTIDLEIEFYENLKGDRLPINQEILLFRVAQEGLNNILKHAKASSVRITLEKEDLFVWLVVKDNGRGFDAVHIDKGYFGLSSVQTRINSLAGRFEINSAKGKGSELRVGLPISTI